MVLEAARSLDIETNALEPAQTAELLAIGTRTVDTQCYTYDYATRLQQAWTATDNCGSTTYRYPAASAAAIDDRSPAGAAYTTRWQRGSARRMAAASTATGPVNWSTGASRRISTSWAPAGYVGASRPVTQRSRVTLTRRPSGPDSVRTAAAARKSRGRRTTSRSEA